MKGTILHTPIPLHHSWAFRVYMEEEVNNYHLEFSPTSPALLLLPLLEVWVLEEQRIRHKSFPHIEVHSWFLKIFYNKSIL